MLLASASGGAEAGWLRARDLQQMNLHAELVVLSGCETGEGSFKDGVKARRRHELGRACCRSACLTGQHMACRGLEHQAVVAGLSP